MHTAFSPALNSRTATWRLPRGAQSCLLITVWSCERQQTGVLSGRLIIGGWRMWKRRPASRGTRRARTFVCTHTSARACWEASTGWHGQSCCWGVHGRRQRLCTTQLLHEVWHCPSIIWGTGRQHDTANCAALVGQWHMRFFSPQFKSPWTPAILYPLTTSGFPDLSKLSFTFEKNLTIWLSARNLTVEKVGIKELVSILDQKKKNWRFFATLKGCHRRRY